MANQLTQAIVIVGGLLLLFHLGGLIAPGTTPNSVLLNFILNTEATQESNWWATILAAIQGVTLIGAIVVGIATRNVELFAMVSVSAFVGGLLFDIVYVYIIVAAESRVLALLLFAPLMLLLGIIIIDWWRKND